MEWFLLALKKYAVFEGRSRRKEYWYFVLFSAIFAFCIAFVEGMLGMIDPSIGLGYLTLVYYLFLIIPSIALSVRRLHDTGRSGWWYLLSLIPFVGSIILLIFYVEDSQPGTNEYGHNPKE